jgi:hypothetical protein
MSCIWTNIGISYNKLQKKLFQNSFIWKKKKNWQKEHAILFFSNPMGSLYHVCTQCSVKKGHISETSYIVGDII